MNKFMGPKRAEEEEEKTWRSTIYDLPITVKLKGALI